MADNAAFASRAQAASRMRRHIGMRIRAMKQEVSEWERGNIRYCELHGKRQPSYDLLIAENRERMRMMRDVLRAGRKPKGGKNGTR